MKVYELIAHLQQQDPKAIVLIETAEDVTTKFGVFSFEDEKTVYISTLSNPDEE